MPKSSPIRHLVVLMMENRSFDHMFGYLGHPKLPDLTNQTNCVVPKNPNTAVSVTRQASPDIDVRKDPGHRHEDVMAQLTSASPPWGPINNGGFAWNYSQFVNPSYAGEVMACSTPKRIHMLSDLALEFAVCSRWFCSVPGPTFPNRRYAHAATSSGRLDNKVELYDDPTVFEALSKQGIGWRIYAGDIPHVMAYRKLWGNNKKDRFATIDAFERAAGEGKLPGYSFLEPRHILKPNSQHPVPARPFRRRARELGRGEELIARVYRALRRGPAWKDTLLLITYDEHGGFYDREHPPLAKPPRPGEVSDDRWKFGFDLLGPRVPSVVISPRVAKGDIDKENTYDHSSIVRTVFELFGVSGKLTDRDGAAKSFLGLASGEPRDTPELTDLPGAEAALAAADAMSDVEDAESALAPPALNEFQESLLHLAQLVDAADRDPAAAESMGIGAPPAFATQAGAEAYVAGFRRRHLSED
jgi:phospholipase C